MDSRVVYELFFLLSKERGQTSGGIIDILTRLAPRDTSILYRQTQKFIKKRGEKIFTKSGGTIPKPTKKKQQNTGKETEKTTKQPKNRLRESIIR